MSLTQLTERVHIFRGGVNFGLIEAPGKRLILVDSGLDSGNARKALRPFLETGYRLTHIINTHSHADHIGGNADLVKRTGCQVWAPAKERPLVLWPELEPLYLYGGAWPPASLQVKFLQAQPTSAVSELPEAPCTFTLDDVTMDLIPVPGHSLQQVAVAVDGVILAADGLFKPEVIEKHPIIFVVNVADYLASLGRLGERGERYILPGHGELIDREGEATDPLPAVLDANRQAMAAVQEIILSELSEPVEGEELLYRVVGRLGKQLDNEPQFFLDKSAVSAHISYLSGINRLQVEFVAGRRLLRRI